MQSYTSAAQGLHEEATSTEIVAAFANLKKQRSAVEDKRIQVALSLDDEERRRKASEDLTARPSSEFARLFSDNVVPNPSA
ncbi:Aste57867_14643 [Aphanomyces stellatus]|uniref:Aste57867_14643 protein n=1 Tax=Aphanomyces stellatus TaxID=120398 RepID=A0A485L1S3_9STRA|nr:hypothetical protein As57867_014588 [Aphanomyces stellatus]VFT91462.1 Aste57867_14643 [Aphanomyces stellatus]